MAGSAKNNTVRINACITPEAWARIRAAAAREYVTSGSRMSCGGIITGLAMKYLPAVPDVQRAKPGRKSVHIAPRPESDLDRSA